MPKLNANIIHGRIPAEPRHHIAPEVISVRHALVRRDIEAKKTRLMIAGYSVAAIATGVLAALVI